jgi:hypothetical protein
MVTILTIDGAMLCCGVTCWRATPETGGFCAVVQLYMSGGVRTAGK